MRQLTSQRARPEGDENRLTVVHPKLLERRPALPASMSPFRDVSMLRALSHTPGDLAVGAANPASVASLLQDRGDALLQRAAQLKAHARSSKVRSTVRQAKQEWLITRTKLRDEESKLQAELARTFEAWATNAQPVSAPPPCTNETARSFSMELAKVQQSVDEAASRVAREVAMVAALSSAVRESLDDEATWQRITEGQGAQTFPGEAPSEADVSRVASDLAATKGAFEEQAKALAREAAHYTADINASWPSAMPPRLGAQYSAAASLETVTQLVDVEAIIRAYPGAEEDTLDLAREAAQATAESFAERAEDIAEALEALGPPPEGVEEPGSHARFYVLWTQAVADVGGRGRSHILDRMALLHPDHTRSEVAAHAIYCEHRHQLQARRRTLATERKRAASELEETLTLALRISEEQAASEAAATDERVARAARSQKLAVELAKMRAAHIAAKAEESARARLERETMEEQERQQAEVEAARREAERALVAEWRAAKKAAVEAEKAAEALRHEQARDASRADASRRLERVAFRQQKRRETLAEKQAEAERRRAAADALEARLAKLRAQVGIDAPTDPNRVFQSTACISAEAMRAPPEMLRGKHAGYTETQLRGDVRYRLSSAMHDAGIPANKIDFVDNARHLHRVLEKAKPFGAREAMNMTSDQRAAYVARGMLKMTR